ncbi:hypothetical protein GCM10009725_13290 [Aeromicrobium tamlense]
MVRLRFTRFGGGKRESDQSATPRLAVLASFNLRLKEVRHFNAASLRRESRAPSPGTQPSTMVSGPAALTIGT